MCFDLCVSTCGRSVLSIGIVCRVSICDSIQVLSDFFYFFYIELHGFGIYVSMLHEFAPHFAASSAASFPS